MTSHPTADGLRAVSDYIDAFPHGDFREALNRERRPEVLFHLSPMRESLLSWYPFDPADTVLELGAGAGALTGLLCRRCAHVTAVEPDAFLADMLHRRLGDRNNLTVVDAPPGGTFDFVVVADVHDLSPTALEDLYALLSPGGRLLLAAENPMGLQYWCGVTRRDSAAPFEHMLRMKGSAKGWAGRLELRDRLLRAGFGAVKCYYPVPDHIYPQDVYSEKLLPGENLDDRIVPYLDDASTLVMHERGLYRNIIREGLFEGMCHSFLFEARWDAGTPVCRVHYAALTAYRDPEHRCATTIEGSSDPVDAVHYAALTAYRDPEHRCATTIEGGSDPVDGVREPLVVRKTPLHPAARPGLEVLAQNHRDLAARGLPVVPVEWQDGTIRMPFVDQPTLNDHLRTLYEDIPANRNRIIALYDRMRDAINRSSDTDPPGSHGWDPAFGPVQRRAYLDLVSVNAFCDPATDQLLFFDQEFTRDHFPAAGVFNRALACGFAIQAHTPDTLALLEELKDRYGHRDIWQPLIQEEQGFLNGLYRGDHRLLLSERSPTWQEILWMAENRMLLAMRAAASALLDKGCRRVLVYGYGQEGACLCGALVSARGWVAAVVDWQADAIRERVPFPLFSHLEEAPPDYDAVVVTVRTETQALAESLRKQTSAPVWTLAEL